MITLISFIILLGILIFVHELGHFLVARLSGVGVEKFSLGFGPKIIGRKIGETEYVLSWIPLGGYVKLLGETGKEDLSPEDTKRSFNNQPTWKKLLIVVAGPVFNFFLAIVIFSIVYMYGLPSLQPIVGQIADESAAMEAGILSGDKVISIGDEQIKYWDDIKPIITKAKETNLKVVVERDGVQVALSVKPKKSTAQNIFGEEVSTYLIGISPKGDTIVQRKNPFSALWSSLQKTVEISQLTILSIVKMIQGVLSPRTLGGPIFIAQVAGDQVKEGIIPFILFMAVLSINLGVINLFPIPVLDGGHILFYLIEMVTRKQIPVKVREFATQIGFVALLMLMLFVIMIDIERLNIKPINDVLKIFK